MIHAVLIRDVFSLLLDRIFGIIFVNNNFYSGMAENKVWAISGITLMIFLKIEQYRLNFEI